MQAHDKVWVVTGGGAGIGRELVRELLRRGARVAAADIDEQGLAQTAELAQAGARLSTHVVDITDHGAVEALVGDVVGVHGAVDGLINNAGIIQPFVAFNDLDLADVRHVLDVNLMGTIYMVKAFLPLLLERPEAHIANVSSMGGYFPFPNQTMYGASKAGVKLLTEGLFGELQGTRVGVSVVMPGPTRTTIATSAGVAPPQGGEDSRMPMTEPDDAARVILAGIEKGRLHIYVGGVARLANIAIRIAPRQAILFVRKQMESLMSTDESTPGASV